MRAAADIEAFARDPVGAYVAGDGWIHWCWQPALFGVVLWDRPNGDAVRELIRCLQVELRPEIAPHHSLVDASRVAGIDPDAFALLACYVRDHHSPLADKVTRLALVRPDGLVGAVTAGFFEVLDSPYPVAVFAHARAGLAWLDHRASPALLDELERAHREHTGVSALVASLRAVLADNLRDIDIAAAATALGLSPRSLQRHLQQDGTTFQRELGTARIREAQRLLVDTDAPPGRIALDVGFASVQHFSTQFRRATGMTPSDWRTSQRAAGRKPLG